MSSQVLTELLYPLHQGCGMTSELQQVQAIAGGPACGLHIDTYVLRGASTAMYASAHKRERLAE